MEPLGKYQLMRRLGVGGMAEVFLAHSQAAQGLAKLVVLKKIHPALAKSKHFIDMFVDEAKIALGLNHPNIVQVFDFGSVDETYFLAMEYVDGVDLLVLLGKDREGAKRIPYGLCAYIAQQVAKGLDYAHRKTDEYGEPLSIIHRDVSPQNILVSWDGSVKLTDFGIARARGVHEEEGVVKGKFAYMAPEQARGDPVDPRADIFSLGVVLFEMACGRPLFPGQGQEVLEKVKAGAIPRARDIDANVPEELEAIIRRALSFRADDRYDTGRDLQRALGRFQLSYAQTQGDMFDSGMLAQFVTQHIERRPPLVAPANAIAEGEAEANPQDSALNTAAGKRSARGKNKHDSPKAVEPRERKHVLVLEGELAGVSSVRQQFGPERAQQAVRDFFRIAENVAYKHDALAHRIASEPDAGRSAFTYVVGLPVAGEDDPSIAMRLGLSLIEALEGIGRDLVPELGLCLGVQMGTAIFTHKGDDTWEYDLSAETTEIARRLAREAQRHEVLVGGRVYRVARRDWNFEELPSIDLPDTQPGFASDDANAPTGGHARARVYRLLGPKERSQRLLGDPPIQALIGRALELKALRETYRDVKLHRERRHILVVGDAGVGKRALVETFLSELGDGEATVLRAAARAVSHDAPYSVIADLARDFLGIGDGGQPDEVQRRLRMAAGLLYPKPEEAGDAAQLVAVIGALLGVESEDADSIDAELRHHRIGDALQRIEAHLAGTKPLVLVLQDTHWADSQSWDVFMQLVRSKAKRPILGVATARPDERVLEAAAEANTLTLVLEELSPAEREQMILQRFAPGENATALAREILVKSGGNPFFIGEVIESLIERGILAVVEEGTDHAGQLVWVKRHAKVQLPASIEALVATRIDQLPQGEKEVLTRSAVLGRAFTSADVSALVGRTVDGDLRKLVERSLIVRDQGAALGQDAYVFRNETTMSVAHDLLPPEEHKTLHHAAAARLANSSSYRKGQDDATLAHHLDQAGDRIGAADRYLAAAKHALQIRGTAEAFRHLTRALKLWPKDYHQERFAARTEREEILRASARRPQQLREIHLMRRHADALKDARLIAQSLTRLAQFYSDVGKQAAAHETLAEALAIARECGDGLIQAEVLRVKAATLRFTGQNEELLDLCEQALALCGDDLAATQERAQIANIRGTALWNMSRLREALDAYADALAIYKRLRLPRQEAQALNNMGIVFASLGEYEEALLHYKKAVKLDTELGDRAAIGLKLGNIGQLYLDAGDLAKAERYLTKALVLDEQYQDDDSSTDATISLGQVYWKQGDAARGRALFERGLQLAKRARSSYQEIRALLYLAQTHLEAGDRPEGALELARSATKLAHAMPMPVGEIYGMTVEAKALAKMGKHEEAARRSLAALTLLDDAHNPDGIEEILYMQVQIARAGGRSEDVYALLERAHREAQSKALRFSDENLRNCYLNTSPVLDIEQEYKSGVSSGA